MNLTGYTSAALPGGRKGSPLCCVVIDRDRYGWYYPAWIDLNLADFSKNILTGERFIG
jgi:hypothetical protein